MNEIDYFQMAPIRVQELSESLNHSLNQDDFIKKF